MDWYWYVLIAVAAIMVVIVAGYLFMIFPASASKSERKKLVGRNYAHRGYHNNVEGLPPENTCEAFDEACKAGYGMELDVQFTSDDVLIVFHDDDYARTNGDSRKVWEVDWEQTQKFDLFGRKYKVPLFSEVLKTVNGRTPIIVEIKAYMRTNEIYYKLCEATWQALKDYKGDWCVESFNPYVIKWWRKNHPEVIRGQLAYKPYKYAGALKKIEGFLLGTLMTGVMTRPHFIAFDYRDYYWPVKLVRALGAMTVMWTCEDAKNGTYMEERNDMVIFQHYAPKAIYKETE